MPGFKLSDHRYEEIKIVVVDMFERYGVACVPINGFEIAVKMGITVIPYSAYSEEVQLLLCKNSFDGFFVETNNEELFIFYNDRQSYGRINNTIMHEIAHIILGHTEDSDLADAEVNFFAKYALAPPVLIYKLGLNSSVRIAEMFEISYEAASYAFNYYQKWLRYGDAHLKPYEIKTLNLFQEVI